MFIPFMFFVSPALAGDAAPTNAIVASPFGGNPELSVLAIVMTCHPTDTHSASFETTEHVLRERNDTAIIAAENPNSAELMKELDDIRVTLDGAQFSKVLFLYEGAATGGDTNDETLGCAEPIVFADLMERLKPLGTSAIAVLDASQADFGPTANDWRDAGMPGFAISSGPEGKKTTDGLMAAFAETVKASNGGTITMGDLVIGLRTRAPLLELAFSTGVNLNDGWTNNPGRQIFPGGGVVAPPAVPAPLPTVAATPPKKKVPTGCAVAGAGVLLEIGAGVFAFEASTNYATLVEYNNKGGESQEELQTAVDGYHTDLAVAITSSVLGSVAIIGGTWMVLDHKVELTVTPGAAMLHGTF